VEASDRLQGLDRLLGRDGVDVEAGAPLEAGHARQHGHELDVPMEEIADVVAARGVVDDQVGTKGNKRVIFIGKPCLIDWQMSRDFLKLSKII